MTATSTHPFDYLQKTHRIDQVQEMIKAMDTDGFVLVPNALTQKQVQELRNAIDGLKPICFDKMSGVNHHFKNVFNQNPYFLQYIDQPGMIDVVEGCLGADCHIIGETAWRSYPGHNGGGGSGFETVDILQVVGQFFGLQQAQTDDLVADILDGGGVVGFRHDFLRGGFFD